MFNFNTFIQKSKFNKIISEKKQQQLPVKLHLGCGTVYKEGWINIDNNSENNIEKLDIKWDLKHSLPIEDNCVDFIYHEHLFEHLTVEEGQKALKEFMRVLKHGGVMRIAMPNLKVSVNKYLNPDWRDDPALKKFGLEYVKTRAEMLNMNFRAWGHKWLYDDEELKRRLKEAGYKKIVPCSLYKSKYKDLQNIETREQSTLIMEVIK